MSFSKFSPSKISIEAAQNLTGAQKSEYFHEVRIGHPRVNSTLRELQMAALPQSGSDIALLIGPSGVGKSTVSMSMEERINQEHRAEIEADPSFIPVIRVEAPSSGESVFSWRTFYTKIGLALNEPLMNKNRVEGGRHTVVPVTSGSTVAALRMAVEKAIKGRRLKVLIIDEAVHIMRSAKGSKLASHMDALKSLANICGVTLVLVGAYDLYEVMCLSGQLARRSAMIHFGRYRPGIAEDEKSFRASIASLQKYLPLVDVPPLVDYAPELVRSCVGCVGILKQTLERMLIRVTNNKGVWDPRCLQNALLTEMQVQSILEETLSGERNIQSAIYGTGILGLVEPKRRGAA